MPRVDLGQPGIPGRAGTHEQHPERHQHDGDRAVEHTPGPRGGEPAPEVAAAAVNRGVERMVLDAPGQYMWGYARGKQPRAEG